MPRDHGSFPDRARVALLLIDVINALDFPGSSSLLEQALSMAKRLAILRWIGARLPQASSQGRGRPFNLRQR
jgi:hypothetical protein